MNEQAGNIPAEESNEVPPLPEKVVELEPDEPPKSGEWVDIHDEELSEEEISEGQRLGMDIDVDDDEDNGGVE